MPFLPCHPAKTGLGFQEPPLGARLGLPTADIDFSMTAGSNGDQQQELKGKTPPPQNARNFQLPQKNNLREKLGTHEPPLSYVIIA